MAQDEEGGEMMSDTKTASSSGVGFSGLLTIVFITLKLLRVIDWSWWWVLSPTLIPAGIVLVLLLVATIFIVWDAREERRRLLSSYKRVPSCGKARREGK